MKQILVVDDLPEIRLVYSALFNDSEVEVLEAADGREALQVLEMKSVDLVLTDCKMPNMTGVELMREAKKRYPDLPFIVVSSTAQKGDLRGLNPYAVMPKPFRVLDLKETVQKALKES